MVGIRERVRSGAVLTAALLLSGSVVFAGSTSMEANVSSGDRAAFFPLAPARILETRSPAEGGGGTVDGQFAGGGALGAGATLDLQVTGRGGVPAGASSVVLNVTAVDQRGGQSFITVFPTGTTRPTASNLNPSPGAPPAPNSVTATIGAGGKVSLFTLQGPVHLLADVVGYYAPHDHDDRYYTKAQVDAMFPDTGRVQISGAAFVPVAAGVDRIFGSGCSHTGSTSQVLVADVNVPFRATITSISALLTDSVGTNASVELQRRTGTVIASMAMVTATGSGTATYTTTLGVPEVVDPGEYFFLAYSGPDIAHRVCGAIVNYTLPAPVIPAP
jgi:hypothetical protein